MIRVEAYIRGKRPHIFSKVDDAFEEARKNDLVWKIIWTVPDTNERICFTRIANTRSTILWRYDPQSIIEHG